MRALAGLSIVAAMSLPAHGQGSLNMSGTWELVRETSSPRPAKLCDSKIVAGLKGEPCYSAMPQIIVEEAPDHFTVTGYIPFLPYVGFVRPDPGTGVAFTPSRIVDGTLNLVFLSKGATVVRATVSLGDAFTLLGTIDGTLVRAIRSKDAIVVRVYRPEQQGQYWCAASASSWGGGPPFGVESLQTTNFYDHTLPGRALQCLENRFALDPSGALTIRSGWVSEAFETHVQQVFRRIG